MLLIFNNVYIVEWVILNFTPSHNIGFVSWLRRVGMTRDIQMKAYDCGGMSEYNGQT